MPLLSTAEFLTEIPWVDRTETRSECFMAYGDPYPYTYGQGRGVRTYNSIPMTPLVGFVMEGLNRWLQDNISSYGPMTGCFLNRYLNHLQHLGWHADDFAGMDHSKCVAVISLGVTREIWWRDIGDKGEVPPDCRQALEHGSLFIMPPGMQHVKQHRIPKGSREMGPRISLTFRAFL